MDTSKDKKELLLWFRILYPKESCIFSRKLHGRILVCMRSPLPGKVPLYDVCKECAKCEFFLPIEEVEVYKSWKSLGKDFWIS